jgi:Ca-activated chloride channel family protein
VRVSLRGRELAPEQRPVTNLVFLIDVSGSMQAEEKLPLLKEGMRLLVEQLGEKDTVAIAVYAGAAGLVLPPTSGADKGKILSAINTLEAGGSTNGGAGIELAYRTAIEGFVEGGVNRVVLCTDGDWNVGVSSVDALERLIEEKRRTGVFLTCLGFGVYGGDQRMETLADKGNGHYAVIDDLREARRVLVDEMSGTLVTIAKDAKVQVEWNEARVRRYRLVGYENRVMANQDFTDDAKDGGELGAGHRVTALYEVEPADVVADPEATLLTLRLRWKEPDGETSSALELVGRDRGTSFDDATSDLKFVASVAAGGMLLRGSPHAGDATWARAIRWGSESLGKDTKGERAEWLDLLRRAARISNQPEVEQTPIGVNGTPGSNARG